MKMALSKPQLGIQSPIQCQLCEQSSKISWKCLECDLLMCNVCKNNIHPKIKTTGEHRIISSKDIGSTLSPSKVIGSISPSNKDPTNVDITVVEEYQTKLEGVGHLAISLDDSLWIGDGDCKKGKIFFTSHTGLQKVKFEGTKLKVKYSFNIHVNGMSITPGNDLLIATYGQDLLTQIRNGTNKVVNTVYKVDPYHPVYIYVTSKNKVIVGTETDTGDKGMVIVMDLEGNHEKVYGEDQTKGISFTLPFRITESNNGNIFVVDIINYEGEGRVIVLGHEHIIQTYCGHSVINTENKTFTPSDLTTTPAGNVIVEDIYRYTLHILNSTGNLISYISTKDKGIVQNPFSVGLTMVGHFCMLYLGTYPPVGSKDKGKLYKLNLTGC